MSKFHLVDSNVVSADVYMRSRNRIDVEYEMVQSV